MWQKKKDGKNRERHRETGKERGRESETSSKTTLGLSAFFFCLPSSGPNIDEPLPRHPSLQFLLFLKLTEEDRKEREKERERGETEVRCLTYRN